MREGCKEQVRSAQRGKREGDGSGGSFIPGGLDSGVRAVRPAEVGNLVPKICAVGSAEGTPLDVVRSPDSCFRPLAVCT
ncbi:unnamed protein product [Coffea canephora]|uniref:Uncharacterized protein n=1 Tax=Coffea canephora TaxID=49390 RepID=A0A068TLZ4_COFCA|nr:unnamed protein product [Coffea canephora]